jgi:hypothetical protein
MFTPQTIHNMDEPTRYLGAIRGGYTRGRSGPVRGNQGQTPTIRPGGPKPQVQAQVVALNKEDLDAAAVAEGKDSIFGKKAKISIDTSSTLSFIASTFACTLGAESEEIPYEVMVSTPLGKQMCSNRTYGNCDITLRDVILRGNHICLPVRDYDAILGMDWFFLHHA